jgi:hypothetical protein
MASNNKYVKIEQPNNEISIGILQPKPRKIRKKIIFINENGYKIKACVSNYHTSGTDSDSDSEP